MDAVRFGELLVSLQACLESREWAKDKTLQEAWDQCTESKWMLWLLARQQGKIRWPSKKDFLLTVCDVVEPVMQFVNDDQQRPQKCLQATRDYAEGKISLEMLLDAKRAAVADAAVYADAAAAAYSAAYSVDAVDDVYAAAYAAVAASAAVYAADAVDDACASRREQCSIIRKRIPAPFNEV